MKHVVRRSAFPLDHDVAGALERFGVATVHEAQGRTGLTDPRLRPIYPGRCVAGRAVTVLSHPGDNLMLHAAIEMCDEGDVLVYATTSVSTDGAFGELLATSARARGVVALVTDAGVRDVSALREMDFPVWARAVSAQGTVKATPGSVNVDVVVGGAVVRSGDFVVADDDGVVIVPRENGELVAAASATRTANEAEKRRRLAAGELGVDMYGLRDLLAKLGVTYEEGQ